MLRDDVEHVVRLVCEILEASVGYYATAFGTERASELSRQIRAKSKTAGMKLSAVNVQLVAFNKQPVDVGLWTTFKAAAARHLDVKRSAVWKDDDPRLAEIYKAAHHVHGSLNHARYANA